MPTRLILTMLLACALLACSPTTQQEEPAETPTASPPLTNRASIATAPQDEPGETSRVTKPGEPGEVTPAPPPPTGSPPPSPAGTSAVPYFGEESIEERIARADIVVKVRLSQTTNVVVRGSGDYSDKYYPALKFHLTVNEYLNGRGADSITALWVRGKPYGTQTEAEDAVPGIAAGRVTTWDDREAVLFLKKGAFDGFFSAALQGDNEYYLAFGGTYQDGYSLHDIHSKLWLPSKGTTATGDSQEFLLAVPEPGVDTPTITLGELKRRIAAVNAELNAGDGSDAYKDCVRNKYVGERIERYRMSGPGYTGPPFEPIWGGTLPSGQPAGAELYEYDYGFVTTVGADEEKTRFWIDGQDAALFSIEEGDRRPYSVENGERFAYSVVSKRPIPAGTYEFTHHYGGFIDCGDNYTFEITANVLAPDDVLHELFFDPVTVGTTVAADDTNGVLKPVAFTDANGASATIESISYEPAADSGQAGTVKLEVDPHTGLADHVVDFIELDGSVSLSLRVADATVDAANDTLSWSASSQPWEDGDMLMVRIREGLPYAPAPQDLGVSLSGDTFTISWSAVAGADQYRVGHRAGGSEGEWTDLDATTGTSQAFSPEGGAACGTTYDFRVQAQGNGETHVVAWGAASEPASHTTGSCN